MKRYIVALAVLAAFAVTTLLPTGVQGRVKDTPHNLNLQAGINVPNDEVCRPCHAPHNASPLVGYIWNHQLTTATFTTHEGATSDDVINSTSRLCLSCHDGTVALDSYGGATGTQFIGGSELIGTNLVLSHPVGIEYPALGSFGYQEPDVDGNIVSDETPPGSSAHLEDGRVQCVSCHFAHGSRAAYGMFLRIDNTGSALCMTCHLTPG